MQSNQPPYRLVLYRSVLVLAVFFLFLLFIQWWRADDLSFDRPMLIASLLVLTGSMIFWIMLRLILPAGKKSGDNNKPQKSE